MNQLRNLYENLEIKGVTVEETITEVIKKPTVMVASFPYGGTQQVEVTDFIIGTVLECKAHPDLDDGVFHRAYDDTPIYMTRNLACDEALKLGVDFLVMVDSDMVPDEILGAPEVKPFFRSSIDCLLDRRARGLTPAVIAAPYVGPPPDCWVYVFNWSRGSNPGEISGARPVLKMIDRDLAAIHKGIHEVAALPTGLMIIDTEVLKGMTRPYFDYEWEDDKKCKKATTEDVYFTRNASLLGFPQLCNYDAWAGHVKRQAMHRPVPWFIDRFRADLVENLRLGLKSTDRIEQVMIKDGKIVPLHGPKPKEIAS